jgi:hypothetical protein
MDARKDQKAGGASYWCPIPGGKVILQRTLRSTMPSRKKMLKATLLEQKAIWCAEWMGMKGSAMLRQAMPIHETLVLVYEQMKVPRPYPVP